MHKLTIYTTTFTDTCDGELVNPDTTESVHECEPDGFDTSEGISAVDLAADYLAGESLTAPSTSPVPATGSLQGLWFFYVDGSYISDYYTGERTEASAHPEGFSDEELRAVCQALGLRLSKAF